jgi:hypothetical protein
MDIKQQEDLIKFWTWVFGKDGVEISKGDFLGELKLYVYRREGWNTEDKEWNIDPIPPIPDLNLLYKYAIPKLQKEGKLVRLIAYECNGFMAEIENFSGDLIAFQKADSPTEALCNAIMKVIENEQSNK